jgi:hypothetical protein
MAAGRLPEPGTEFGPCIEPCKHRDCLASRQMAEAICPECKKPIGYGVGFYKRHGGEGELVHAACEEGV